MSGQAGLAAASITTSAVRPTMPFFLVTPKLARSSRAVARNRTRPSSAPVSVTRSSAGTVVPCAVTEPLTSQPGPSWRAPVPSKLISG